MRNKTIIYTTHGIVERASQKAFVHRNLLDYQEYVNYLDNREPFVALDTALDLGGEALTIDDSTKAAANAALEARRKGHEITLFINPLNIESQENYPLMLLNVVIDDISNSLCFNGLELADISLNSKKKFRKKLKEKILQCTDELEQLEYVRSFAEYAGVDIDPVPEHLRPISSSDLQKLNEEGVNIQNHGWAHTHFNSLTAKQAQENLLKGKLWIEQQLCVQADYFAVPFGDCLPSHDVLDGWKTWFLLTKKEQRGFLRHKIFNRTKLELEKL